MTAPVPIPVTPPWLTRGAALAACALAALTGVGYLAGAAWLPAAAVLCTDGLLAVAWVVSAGMLGAVVLSALRLLRPGDAPRPGGAMLTAVTASGLGMGLFSLAALALGLAGLLNQITAIGLLVVGPVLAIVLVAVRQGNVTLAPWGAAIERFLRAPAGWSWLWVLAMPALAVALVSATLPPGLLWPGDPHPYDVVEYHLQVPREWYEAGRIAPLSHNVFSYFPFNLEMHYLLAMHVRGGPWAGMYLAQFLSLAHMALAVAAVYASARAAGASRAGATVGAVAMSAVPWIAMLASVAYNESALVLYGALAVGWVVAYGTNDIQAASGDRWPAIKPFALAGLFAGLACGAKYTAVPILLAGLPAILLGVMLARRVGVRPTLARLGVYLAAAVLAFAPWLVRNWAWAGNPVFPEAMSILGRGHFAPQQVERWQRAHSPRQDQRPAGARLAAFAHEVLRDARYGRVFWPMALVGAVAAVALRRGHRFGVVLGMLLALAAFWLALTHLQSRFFVLGVPLATLLIALGAAGGDKVGPSAAGATRALLGIATLWLAVSGSAILYRELQPFIRPGGPFGASDYRPLLPPPVAEAVTRSTPLALAGDAKAFFYQLPMSRLSYRTVFDVDTTGGADLIDAWLGRAGHKALAGTTIVIDPAELKRLGQSYRVPGAYRFTGPFIEPQDLEPFRARYRIRGPIDQSNAPILVKPGRD